MTVKTTKDFIVSDGSRINSRGFRIELKGGNFERFDANPVLLYDHDTDKLIGRWENRRIEGDKMLATPVFDLNNEFAAEKARQVDEDFLRAASIGLRILNLEKVGDEWVATEWELIEMSITPIPSDAGACRLYDESRIELTFEQVKLNFNKQQSITTMADEKKINLSESTRVSLSLPDSFTERDIEISVSEKDQTIANLKLELKTEQDARIDTFLSNAVKDGKISTDQKNEYSELAQLNFAKVEKIINGIDSKPMASLVNQPTKTDLSDGRESWTFLDWMKKDGNGLKKLRHENPTEYERIKTTI